MIMEIGIVAGDIWHFLEKQERAKVKEIFKEIKKPQEIILMSLGWLAREGYVFISCDEDGYVVSFLRPDKE